MLLVVPSAYSSFLTAFCSIFVVCLSCYWVLTACGLHTTSSLSGLPASMLPTAAVPGPSWIGLFREACHYVLRLIARRFRYWRDYDWVRNDMYVSPPNPLCVLKLAVGVRWGRMQAVRQHDAKTGTRYWRLPLLLLPQHSCTSMVSWRSSEPPRRKAFWLQRKGQNPDNVPLEVNTREDTDRAKTPGCQDRAPAQTGRGHPSLGSLSSPKQDLQPPPWYLSLPLCRALYYVSQHLLNTTHAVTVDLHTVCWNTSRR